MIGEETMMALDGGANGSIVIGASMEDGHIESYLDNSNELLVAEVKMSDLEGISDVKIFDIGTDGRTHVIGCDNTDDGVVDELLIDTTGDGKANVVIDITRPIHTDPVVPDVIEHSVDVVKDGSISPDQW